MTVRVRRWATTFDSLRNQGFRWLWLGRLSFSATFAMTTVAQGWLVYELTGSGTALAWVSSGGSVSMLCLSLVGGALSDRMQKRKLMVWCQAGMALNVLLLGLLVGGGWIRIWLMMASSVLSGVFFSLMMPAQQAITAELVDRETLLNAISLNSIGMGLMSIVGSSVAGLVIERFGAEGVYYAAAALNLLTALTWSRLPASGHSQVLLRSVWRDLFDGLRYLRQHRVLLVILGLGLARVLFAMPYRTFMPKFASEVMGFDATGLGLLLAAPGVGSLISSLTVASLRDFRSKGRLLLAAGIVLGACLAGFVSTQALWLVLGFLVIVGGMGNVCMVLSQTLLQSNSDDRFRGRVMSVYMLAWGLSPLGTIPAGVASDLLGVRLVIALQGMLVIAAYAAILVLRPAIRRME